MLSVAVIGGGLCGLGTTYHLLARGHHVTVIDGACNRGVAINDNGHFRTASAVAAGLLHPLSPRLKMTWCGEEAYDMAFELIQATGSDQIVTSSEVYRPCRDDEDRDAVTKAASKLGSKELEILDANTLTAAVPWSAMTRFGGVRIVRARVIDAQRYMSLLWKACECRGAVWQFRQISNIDEFYLRGEFDRVIFCGGASGLGNKLLGDQTSLIRGQSVKLHSVQQHNSLALLRGDYLAPLAEPPATYILGATRERISTFEHSLAYGVDSPHTLLTSHLQKAAFDMAPSTDFTPICATAGVRLDGPKTNFGRLPVLAVPKPGLIFAGALGSRGLLRHAQVGALAAELASLDLGAKFNEYIPLPLRLPPSSKAVSYT